MKTFAVIENDGNFFASAEKEGNRVPKTINMTAEYVAKFISYDPMTGDMKWIKSTSRRIKPGDPAGAYKETHGKSSKKYRYIGLNGVQTPAARVAWLLHHGEWPQSPVMYRDGNADNLAADNLKMPEFPTTPVMRGDQRVYKMSREAQRHYGLKRYYGMSREEYNVMLAEQDGKCAICKNEETAIFKGRPKELHVDHCHETGKIRGLLCGCCNGGLGLFKDNVDTILAAIRYLKFHSGASVPVVLKEVT